MEQKINIAEILKDKPQRTKLYDLLRNIEVELDSISHTDYENIIWCRYNDVNPYDLYGYSTFGTERGWLNGLQILLPSKKMRDWNKLAWKKGDVLTNSSGFQIFFDKWANEDYTKFLGKIKLLGNSHCYDTANYSLESKEEALEFIKSVEEINNGKLNRETLEIEKLEFKDGDILSCDEDTYTKHTTLILHKNGCVVESLVSLIRHHDLVESREPINEVLLSRLYYAREDEKKELFDALAKGGKAWDAEKKMLVDLKLKVRFKSFDKVVVFDELAKKWECGMFSHYSKNYEGKEVITCIGGYTYLKVLPFNEETTKLVGTTNNVEE